jgi:hypothetical protein
MVWGVHQVLVAGRHHAAGALLLLRQPSQDATLQTGQAIRGHQEVPSALQRLNRLDHFALALIRALVHALEDLSQALLTLTKALSKIAQGHLGGRVAVGLQALGLPGPHEAEDQARHARRAGEDAKPRQGGRHG